VQLGQFKSELVRSWSRIPELFLQSEFEKIMLLEVFTVWMGKRCSALSPAVCMVMEPPGAPFSFKIMSSEESEIIFPPRFSRLRLKF